jgi:hypothetical protein
MLQAYNCERQRGPKKEVMPAEKQVRRDLVSNVARIGRVQIIQQRIMC